MDVQQFNFVDGVNVNVSPFLMGENECGILNGVNPFYIIGSLLKDNGYEKIGSTLEASKEITGLFNFRQTGAEKMLATINNADDTALTLQYNNAGTWTAIDTDTTYVNYEDAKTSFEQFINYCFIVGYDDTDKVFLPVGSLINTTFSTVTNVGDMPQGKFIKRYRDRLYVANCSYDGTDYPFRVCFSSIPVAGAITWTTASDFLDVDFADQIMGVGENWDRLIVFTEYSTYLYDQNSWKKAFDIGCSNHKTIVNIGSYMLWANADGVMVSTGGQPQVVSGKVEKFIRACNMRDAFAVGTDEEYRLWLGDVTVDDISYSNLELTFNIAKSGWRWRELSDKATVFAKYNDDGKIYQYMGFDNGMIMKRGKYSDIPLISADNGKAFAVNFEGTVLWLDTADLKKKITAIVAYAKKAQGLSLKYRILDVNNKVLSNYMPLGQLDKFMNKFNIADATNGIMIQIAGSEYSDKPYFEFYGYNVVIEKESIPKQTK